MSFGGRQWAASVELCRFWSFSLATECLDLKHITCPTETCSNTMINIALGFQDIYRILQGFQLPSLSTFQKPCVSRHLPSSSISPYFAGRFRRKIPGIFGGPAVCIWSKTTWVAPLVKSSWSSSPPRRRGVFLFVPSRKSSDFRGNQQENHGKKHGNTMEHFAFLGWNVSFPVDFHRVNPVSCGTSPQTVSDMLRPCSSIGFRSWMGMSFSWPKIDVNRIGRVHPMASCILARLFLKFLAAVSLWYVVIFKITGGTMRVYRPRSSSHFIDELRQSEPSTTETSRWWALAMSSLGALMLNQFQTAQIRNSSKRNSGEAHRCQRRGRQIVPGWCRMRIDGCYQMVIQHSYGKDSPFTSMICQSNTVIFHMLNYRRVVDAGVTVRGWWCFRDPPNWRRRRGWRELRGHDKDIRTWMHQQHCVLTPRIKCLALPFLTPCTSLQPYTWKKRGT